MDALTERTIQRLRERLEALRLKGPIPALMAEFCVGAPEEETGPLKDFVGALQAGALRQLPDGARSSRRLWLAADPTVVADFRNFCRDAGRVAAPLLHAAGHRVGVGTSDLVTRWLWAVFELAELRLDGTDLRLVGDTVWRIGDGGVALGEGIVDNPGPFAGLAATAGDTRYWRLVDAVEASLAALDIAQLRAGATTTPAPIQAVESTSGATTTPRNERARRPRGEATSELLRKLWGTVEGKKKILAAGSAEKIGLMIGKSKTAVVEAGPIWTDKISPQLKAQRSLLRYHRDEERLDG